MAPKIILLSLPLYIYYYYNSTRVHPPRSFQGLYSKHITTVNYKTYKCKITKLHSIELKTYKCRITTYKLKNHNLQVKKIYSILGPKKLY